MSKWELSKLQFLAALLLGIAVSVIISMVFGFILTYTPSVEMIPKIEATPSPTPLPTLTVMSYNESLVYNTNIVVASIFEVYQSPLFIFIAIGFLIFSMMIFVNRMFTIITLVFFSVIAWMLFPDNFSLLMAIPIIYIIYSFFTDMRGDF